MSGTIWYSQTPEGVEVFAHLLTDDEGAELTVLVQPRSASVRLTVDGETITDSHWVERAR